MKKKKGVQISPGQVGLFGFPTPEPAAGPAATKATEQQPEPAATETTEQQPEPAAGPAATKATEDDAGTLPPRVSLPPEIQMLMQERGLSHGEPCPRCACELYWNLPYTSYGEPKEDTVCLRCYPKKGYHQYSDQVDRHYPRRRLVEEW